MAEAVPFLICVMVSTSIISPCFPAPECVALHVCVFCEIMSAERNMETGDTDGGGKQTLLIYSKVSVMVHSLWLSHKMLTCSALCACWINSVSLLLCLMSVWIRKGVVCLLHFLKVEFCSAAVFAVQKQCYAILNEYRSRTRTKQKAAAQTEARFLVGHWQAHQLALPFLANMWLAIPMVTPSANMFW